ncbi:hypothetical protein L1987_13929 [Smallanthus sonchifolius]|uniref:Uncharacterized protein n=1 Tax=Smallanthus sonchifolius TaxID=185202 RepID=A0ACB9JHT2_9ASTR|nr:hypothetical protein L1987_13929 [Smallanthus sonchifolius]
MSMSPRVDSARSVDCSTNEITRQWMWVAPDDIISGCDMGCSFHYSSSGSVSTVALMVRLPLISHSHTMGSLRNKFLLLIIITFLAFSEATSRFPKEITWEQMVPKKFPTPSSAPSRGTNSVTDSDTMVETARRLPSADGKV